MVADTDTVFKGVWANVAEYLLVDPETGDVITTYCADITTPTVDGFSYNMENIEDGTYYSDEQAAMIRTVAKNGYWGVIDDPETEEPVVHRLGVEEEPTVEIPEEEVPLANAPTTGDNTGLWAAVILMAAFALCAVNVFTKKRQHETF